MVPRVDFTIDLRMGKNMVPRLDCTVVTLRQGWILTKRQGLVGCKIMSRLGYRIC